MVKSSSGIVWKNWGIAGSLSSLNGNGPVPNSDYRNDNVFLALSHRWRTQSLFAFGDYDLVSIVEMPSNVEMAAFSVAAAAGGAIRSIKTTPLMTTTEGIEAMKKAAKSGYKAPAHAAHA